MNNCYWCNGEPSQGIGDHFIPRSAGGGLGDNLFPCCKPCNSMKGNRLWFKENEEIAKYKKDSVRLKKIDTEDYEAILITNVFYRKKPHKRMKKNIFDEYGEKITKTVERIRVKAE